jgi:hypothetical protein
MRNPERLTNMRKKYFREEDVFRFIWDAADSDGIWNGDWETLAAKFNVTKDAAYDALSELCDRHFIERVGNSTYIITGWRERDALGEEELR